MDSLVRKALLGDREAQRECTEKGIVLPCPFCGNKNILISNWGMWRCWCPECLGKSEDSLRERDAIKHWNTRPAPPVGRCKDCVFSRTPTKEDFKEFRGGIIEYKDVCMCAFLEQPEPRWEDDFCSYFKVKED